MKIESVETFLIVADRGSMSEAAESVFTTPQNMSFIIKNLEAELGVELFKRTNKGVALTDEGEKFFPFAATMVQAYRNYHLTRMVGLNAEKAIHLYTTIALGQYLDFMAELEMPQNQQISIISKSMDEILQHLRGNIPGLFLVPVNRENMRNFNKWKHIVLGQIEYIDVYGENKPVQDDTTMAGEETVGLTCFDVWTKQLAGLWNGDVINVGSMEQAKRIMRKKGYVYLVPDLFAGLVFTEEETAWKKLRRIRMPETHALILISNLPDNSDLEYIVTQLRKSLSTTEE